ncbi:neural-cadherin [Caerostris darwini]|uniref:Neural-cadherin n=1 Tax=Caerostris darwini TaxID=1538125 RepID=A0AAV4NF68_9ARAC|nr:neural-cadherin [Caerostris darwini]
MSYPFYFNVTKYIRIGIGDKNDNPPYFEQASYEAEVNEDEDIQHTVITVTAKDKDEAGVDAHQLYYLYYPKTACNRDDSFKLDDEKKHLL